MEKNKICKRCLLDTTVQSIRFDEEGICNFCHSHDSFLSYYSQEEPIRNEKFETLLSQIRNSGRGKKYDCIVGISGGTDSTYTLYMAVKSGLRPLAVYFDNGWSTETSVQNIKNATKKLNVDLYTYVVDWEEFKELQKAFLRASVPCVEVPTDIAIVGVLYKLAQKEKVNFILSGTSFITEGTMPKEWSYPDGTYIKSVNKMYGKSSLKTHPNFTIYDFAYYHFIKKIKIIPFTNFFHYDKGEAREILEKELGWQYYGGHHYENIYSYWAFGWYTYHKFGYDKRKVSLSGPVRMGRLDRNEALNLIKEAPPVKSDTTDYVIKKLGLSPEEFNQIMKSPNKLFTNYKTSYNLVIKFKWIVKILTDNGFISPILYSKMFG